MKAALALEDGTVVHGELFGSPREAEGEVVFNTSHTGFQEALTDPSYRGQILIMTFPMQGNYGILPGVDESDRVQVEGFVVRYLHDGPIHPRAETTLDEFLKDHGVPGIAGVDTRMLTRKIRTEGAMRGVLVPYEPDDRPSNEELLERVRKVPHISKMDLVPQVSTRKKYRFSDGKQEIVVIDCGVKRNILRELAKRDAGVVVVPYNTPAQEIMDIDPDGVVVSNGPGDPKRVKETVETVRELVGHVPLMGICLGNQILGLAEGGDTFKLKFGHRGANQPVKDFDKGKVYITSQNHGFALDSDSLKNTPLRVRWVNVNDGTVEGVVHTDVPAFSVQFHPEAGPGPWDTKWVFDEFLAMCREH
ncbi:glutamine-hydrolyzing carbamoyl-phosphate synthase small subunit [Methanopyrus sp.]